VCVCVWLCVCCCVCVFSSFPKGMEEHKNCLLIEKVLPARTIAPVDTSSVAPRELQPVFDQKAPWGLLRLCRVATFAST
jgi:hypothetical protein